MSTVAQSRHIHTIASLLNLYVSVMDTDRSETCLQCTLSHSRPLHYGTGYVPHSFGQRKSM